MTKALNIVTRKARDNFNEYVVVDRGQAYENDRRYVSATANRISPSAIARASSPRLYSSAT